jgi:hypothetical protein
MNFNQTEMGESGKWRWIRLGERLINGVVVENDRKSILEKEEC